MPVNSMKTKDFSFRMDRTGKMVLTSGAEHVRDTIIHLFGQIPGSDEYNADMGLDLLGRKKRTYREKTRDYSYETEIARQITTYTDLIPASVIAIYMNDCLYVNLQVQYLGEFYGMELSSEIGANLDTLSSMIIHPNEFNRR